jgi:ribonuclease P/MRP protein subunit RPP1
MPYFDFHTHSAFSGGESSLEDLAKTAKQLGYRGVCFVFYYQDERQKDILLAEIDGISKEVGIETYLGFEARDLKELRILVKKRRSFDILLVRGGNLELNRVACETPEVDILTHPEYQRADPGLDHVCMKLATKNNVAIEVNFREILTTNKKTRAMILSNIEHNVRLAKRYHAPIILCSGAISHWELRDPKCLISMTTQLGLELNEAKKSISKVPEKILEQVRERKSEKWILPGVKIVK